MDVATSEELNKIATMKLTVTCFMTKLENFLNETKAADVNLFRLLSNLTASINAFSLTAKFIKTNHMIESVVEKHIWSCENIFKCLACKVETGKTYISVLNHVSSSKHIAQEKLFKKQNESTIAITTTPSNAINSLPQFPANREFEMNRSQWNNHLLLTWNKLSFIHQQPVTSLLNVQRKMLARPNVAYIHQQPLMSPHIQHHILAPQIVSNIHQELDMSPLSPINRQIVGRSHELNPMPSLDHFQNDNDLCQPPLPTNVAGFQQNTSNPSNNHSRNLNQTNEEYKQPPIQSINSNDQYADSKCLHPDAISFLQGNFESDVEEFINAEKEKCSDDLFTAIKANLLDCCQKINVNSEIKCFGSTITDIAYRHSDINLYISAANSRQTAESFLKKLFKILSQNPNWIASEYMKTYVPIIRVRYMNETSLRCEITFNNETGMAKTKLMEYFFRIQPECHKLVVFVKKLIRKANSKINFNKYTITLLVFFYLQSDGHLPKVVDLIEASSHSPNDFTEKILDELNLKAIKTFNELCIGFLKFYCHKVNFKYDVLSVFTGAKIPKSHFLKKGNLVEAFKSPMAIQEPFDHEHNVSDYVASPCLMLFKEHCRKTYNVLNFQSVRENNSP